MNKILVILIISLLSTISYSQSKGPLETTLTTNELNEAPAPLIPFPQKITWNKEYTEIENFYLSSPESVSKNLSKTLKEIADFYKIDFTTAVGVPVKFTDNKKLKREEYQLDISVEGIEIESSTEAGKYYALQTLRQLIQKIDGRLSLPICKINDFPTFPVRGYMIDVGRNFQSMTSLKKQLDILAKYKMNVFHWHLTDRPAWRIQNNKYPELVDSDNHRETRDPGKYYSYKEIRELIRYAKERHITVIPEIDMPGHSDSFVKSMGVKMESEEGMKILEDVLNEFFDEINKEDCPIIHIGSDEVRIPNPEEFISRMVNICKANDRQVIIWNPGLKADSSVIRQTWQPKHLEDATYKEIDSWNSYVNNGEPMTQIQRLFFKPIGFQSKNEVIGGILCFWPDVNLENEMDAFLFNPVYPSILTYAWKTWTADVVSAPDSYYTMLPPKGSVALDYFEAFEHILLQHKDKYFSSEPFQYLKQSDKYWRVIGPLPQESGDYILAKDKNEYSINGKTFSWKEAVGNTIVIKDRFRLGGYYPDAEPGQTVYGITYIHADNAKKMKAWVGFETPLRANRTYTGIPEQGSWDPSNGTIWINNEILPPPEWKNPGWKPSKEEGWASPEDQEIPWRNEELYWTRKPIEISLNKGWNKIIVKSPSSTNYQNWMFTFAPLDMNGLKFSTHPDDYSTYYHQRKTHFENLQNGEEEILFVGDSMTDGCEWAEMFGVAKVKNRGISGDVVQGVLDRLGELVAPKPEKIFLMIGINDVALGRDAAYVVSNIQIIIDRINEYTPNTEIYLQSLLPVNDHFGMFSGHTSRDQIIREVNDGLAKVTGKNITYVDLYPYFQGEDQKMDKAYTNDGLHLKGKGYKLWASLIEKYIK